MKISDIVHNPNSIATSYDLGDQAIIFRPLLASDYNALGAFLESLSLETTKRFQPHPLTKEYANGICQQLDYHKSLRLVAVVNKQIVGYFLLDFYFGEEETRYRRYDITLSQEFDCKIAPVVADGYQNSGLGSFMMEQTLHIARTLQRRYVTLSGGTQATNHRAIHFYEKFGFRKLGQYIKNNMKNYDMCVELHR